MVDSHFQDGLAQDAPLYEQCISLQQQVERLRVFQQVSQDLAWELDLDRLLRNILSAAVQVAQATAGSLLLLDPLTDELVFTVIEGGGGEKLLNTRMSRHQGIAGWVLNHQQAVIVDDTLQDQRYYPEIGASVNFQTTSMITAPMIARGEAIGVLQVLNKVGGECFDQADKELLQAFAAQSATAIRNAQLYQQVRDERDRIMLVEEEARRRLARELHDGPTQVVAAIIMNLGFVRKLLEREPTKVDSELVEVSSLAQRAMHQLRTMLFDLRPVILETKGLLAALEAYVTRLNETEDFTVQLMVQGDVLRLSWQAESAIFAVVQEAIGNAKKHAQARHMWVTLTCDQEVLDVSVRDDGQGFDTSTALSRSAAQGSLGMTNMRERAEMLRGKLSLFSQSGQGATVRLVVPIKPNL